MVHIFKKMFSLGDPIYLQQETKKLVERETPGRWRVADEGAEGSPFGESRWRGDPGKGGEKVKAEAERFYSQGGSLQWLLDRNIFPSLLSSPPAPTPTGPRWLTFWLPHTEKDRATFCMDLPRSFKGLTAAWSSCTSELRVTRVTRRRKPPKFMLLSEVFGKDAAGLRTAEIYPLLPPELGWNAKGGARVCGSLSPAQKLTCPENTHRVYFGLCHIVT